MESYDWYEDQLVGLGSRFIEDVKFWIHKIEQQPDLFSIKYKSYREVSIPTFPFLIIYRINKIKVSVRIVSVFHTARNPKRKYK